MKINTALCVLLFAGFNTRAMGPIVQEYPDRFDIALPTAPDHHVTIAKDPHDDANYPEQLVIRSSTGHPLFVCAPASTTTLKTVWRPVFLFQNGNVKECESVSQDGICYFEQIVELKVYIIKFISEDPRVFDHHYFLIFNALTNNHTNWYHGEFIGSFPAHNCLISRQLRRSGSNLVHIRTLTGQPAACPIQINDGIFEGFNPEVAATDGTKHACIVIRDSRDSRLHFFDIGTANAVCPLNPA